ncbi:MAG TPA: Maf family protein [Candidatus Sulfotelmatobacter sp.]
MLVLASASPRRLELLRGAGISFVVQPADIDETPRTDESPRDCAVRLAREKALAVSRARPTDYVLGADTIVAVDGAILGKPQHLDDAARMLRLLSGRVHEVITGVCVVRVASSGQRSEGSESVDTHTSRQLPVASQPTTQAGALLMSGDQLATENRLLATASETTLVTMRELSDEEIRTYVATGEPTDKAGAYAIQGGAASWIPRIQGDYSNVVGLPVELVCRMLREMGVLECNRPGINR